MWKTFSGRGTYRVYLADPANREAGYYGDITEDNGLLVGMIALRIKVKDHRITELETITVREQKRPKGGLGLNTAGIMTPRMIDELIRRASFRPMLHCSSRSPRRKRAINFSPRRRDISTLTRRATLRWRLLQRSARAGKTVSRQRRIPMVPCPTRRSPRFICSAKAVRASSIAAFSATLAKVRDSRPLVVDEKQGLVLNLAFYDDGGNVKSVDVAGVGTVKVPAQYQRPMTFLAPQLFKIEGGKIREIEGLSWAVPFGMPPASQQ